MPRKSNRKPKPQPGAPDPDVTSADGKPLTEVERLARMDTIEEQLARRVRPLRIEVFYSQKWGCSIQHVRGLIQAVRERWAHYATAEGRTERRDFLRNTMTEVLSLAIERGDLPTAMRACDQLARLDNLDDGEQKSGTTIGDLIARTVAATAAAKAAAKPAA